MAIVTIDGKRYSTHAEVLNGLFGKHYKCYQRAECNLGNGYSVWFPVVTNTTNPAHAIPAYNGWKNALIKNDTEIHQYWPDPKDAIAQTQNPPYKDIKRITFAKDSSGDKYVFIGVFEKIQNAPDHTVYKCIATQYPLPQ